MTTSCSMSTSRQSSGLDNALAHARSSSPIKNSRCEIRFFIPSCSNQLARSAFSVFAPSLRVSRGRIVVHERAVSCRNVLAPIIWLDCPLAGPRSDLPVSLLARNVGLRKDHCSQQLQGSTTHWKMLSLTRPVPSLSAALIMSTFVGTALASRFAVHDFDPTNPRVLSWLFGAAIVVAAFVLLWPSLEPVLRFIYGCFFQTLGKGGDQSARLDRFYACVSFLRPSIPVSARAALKRPFTTRRERGCFEGGTRC